jgi:hypothetical protein
MRAMLTLSVLLMTAAWTHDPYAPSSGRTRDDVGTRTLSSEQIAHYAGAYLPAIRTCYVDHALGARRATGELSLELVVDRSGRVSQLTTKAPGVTGRRLRALDACIRDQVATWRFPVRRGSTTAVLPYYFLHVRAPNSGPYPSCWNPKGCPVQGDRPARPSPI